MSALVMLQVRFTGNARATLALQCRKSGTSGLTNLLVYTAKLKIH
jgi:hypothetical protein